MFTFLRVAGLVQLRLRVFILNNKSVSLHSLLLKLMAAYGLGDIGHVEDVLGRLLKLHWLRLQHWLPRDEVSLIILDEDDLALQLFLLPPDLLVGLNEAIIVFA
jgi:hypothetical protein